MDSTENDWLKKRHSEAEILKIQKGFTSEYQQMYQPIPEQQLSEIKKRAADGENKKKLAEEYKISLPSITV